MLVMSSARIDDVYRVGLLMRDFDVGHAEGSWDEVMQIIGRAHSMLHKQGVVRIQTDIRVGSRFVGG